MVRLEALRVERGPGALARPRPEPGGQARAGPRGLSPARAVPRRAVLRESRVAVRA